ncbi:MAG: hypothetical protein PHH83_03775 [Patescibacteria group bacterium]|nr:hypothetical protein [Patescibacteria group bacterium]
MTDNESWTLEVDGKILDAKNIKISHPKFGTLSFVGHQLEDKELEEYRKAVEYLAEHKVNWTFPCSN